MRVTIKTVDEDDIDESPTSGGVDLCEAEAIDLWSARSCLWNVSISKVGPIWQT